MCKNNKKYEKCLLLLSKFFEDNFLKMLIVLRSLLLMFYEDFSALDNGSCKFFSCFFS